MSRSNRRVLLPGLAASLLLAVGCNSAAGGEELAGSGMPTAVAPQTPADIQRATFTFSGEMTQGGWIRGDAPGGTASLTLDGSPVELAGDGRFFAAFDRDAAPVAKLEANLRGGGVITREITVSPRAWRIEHVNVARRQGGASEAFMALRRPELARINAARARDTGSEGWRKAFIWPVRGRISGRFGSQRIYRGEPASYHSGIDITTGASGTPFVAPADGVVILAADHPFTLEGNLLMIDHGAGLNSAFLHCSKLFVKDGDRVTQGQVIGLIGMTRRATGPHLHWSMKWRDSRIDPILLTGPMP